MNGVGNLLDQLFAQIDALSAQLQQAQQRITLLETQLAAKEKDDGKS